MDKENRALIYLAASVINGHEIDSGIKSRIDPDQLYTAAESHQLTAMTAYALESIGLVDPRFETAKNQAVWKELLFDQERERLEQELEDRNIWHMPLKGVVIKDYYPEIGMRQMSDNDILFDAASADEVRDLMLAMDYTVNSFGKGHQDDYTKSPVFHFEMHRRLFPTTMVTLTSYYENVKQRLIRDEGSQSRFHFRVEDFYIYLAAHLYKHYYWEGAGLRALLDLYILIKNMNDSADWDYIRQETSRAGIDGFEERARTLALKVFTKGTVSGLTPKEVKMLDYLAYSGDFGSRTAAASRKEDRKQELAYFKRRIILPDEVIKVSYPFFYKHRALIPLLPAYRLISRWDNARSQIKNVFRK